MGGRINGTLR